MSNEIKGVQMLKWQREGDYLHVSDNYALYRLSPNIFNYIHPALEIQFTPDMGRGVFATKNISAGSLLIIEKPLAYVESNLKL